MKKLYDFIKSKKIEIPISISIILLVIACLLINLAVIMADPNSFKTSLALITKTSLVLILNAVPVALLLAFVFFVTNKALFSISISGAIFIIGSVVNREKIILRQDPFIPGDISLFSEAFGIVKNFPPSQLFTYALIILVFLAVIIITFLFFGTKKIRSSVRIILASLTVVLSVILNFTAYSSDSLYDSFPVEGNIYFDVNQYASKGFVYSFIYKLNSMRIEKPDGYNNSYFIAAEEDYEPEEYTTDQLPHIIMIMGEAFSDLSENSHFDFTNYGDPMENFKRLANSENAISGHIIVPNFGGGTSNTEFDVLTGYPTRSIVNDGIAYNYIRSSIDAIPNRLLQTGYNTLAIHPGFSWFYNRSNVYPYMGFENFIHLSSFQGEEKYKGGYIADKYAIDSIMENFQSHIQTSDNPLFEFCVTIENHGPYDEKYNEVNKMFDCDIELTQLQETLLNSYFMGIKDNDYEIGRLADYLSEIDEPVILVFFGDHLPGFSNGMEFFDLLDYNISPNGSIEQQLNVYGTPFLIWENDAAAELTDFNQKVKNAQLPENNKISANYLGTLTLELAGIDNISPFYDYENELRRKLPVIRDDSVMFTDGQYSNEIDDSLKADINLLTQWSYYKVFDS